MERTSYESTLDFININKNLKCIIKYLKIKPLSLRLKSKGGRQQGHIIMPRRGELNRRIYRIVDFKRIILPGVAALVLRKIYDPNRSSNLCLVCYPIGLLSYILEPMRLNTGELIINNSYTPVNYGDSGSLTNFPSGVLIHNIGGKFIRSAGCSAILIRKDFDQALIKLKSGELRFFHTSLIASLGTIGNEDHFLHNYKYASSTRYIGRRPRVRPSAMNPVDHPLGGRTRGGSQPVDRKGIITLNRRTVYKHHPAILYTKRQLKLLRL